VYDLAEETPETLVQHEAPWLLPIWTASRSIARTCFSGGNGMLTVVVNDAKATLPPHFRSVDALDTTEGDSDLRLSRFLAWPITSARRVRATNSESATALWAQLRGKTCVRQSTVALVIDNVSLCVPGTSNPACSGRGPATLVGRSNLAVRLHGLGQHGHLRSTSLTQKQLGARGGQHGTLRCADRYACAGVAEADAGFRQRVLARAQRDLRTNTIVSGWWYRRQPLYFECVHS